MNNNITSIGDWLTEKRVSEILNLKQTAIWKLKTTGKLSYSKVGRRIFYKKSDVEKLLEENYIQR